MNILHAAQGAAERIRPFVRRTPMELSAWLSQETGAEVYLKFENLQRTGSFKLRGALSRLTLLSQAELAAGVVAASTGNHGAAVALGARLLGTHATVFAPNNARGPKLESIRALGAAIQLAGDDCVEAERRAREHATELGATYISPYNDEHVIAGQATVGLEMFQDRPDLEAVFVAVGGGGLISGVGGVLKATTPNLAVVGASPRASAVLRASLEAGRILEEESHPTLSDATAGGLEEGSITFEICQRTIDRFLLVEETEIADALRAIIDHEHTLIEGAAAVPVAALLAARERYRGQRVGIVLCGANISGADLKQVL